MGRTINCKDGKAVKRVNVCNILFDEKYKAFIKKMKEEFLELMGISITCYDYEILGDIQQKYRDYVLKYKKELTLIESKKFINQEYFAVLVSLIFDNIDNIEKFDDIFKKHKNDFTFTHFEDNGSEEPSQIIQSHCCCGHLVHSNNTYTLRNNTTGYRLLIGNDCILKNNILSFEELRELNNKRRFKERTKVGKCYFCGKNGKCKACKNIKIAKDVFQEWKHIIFIWKHTRLFNSNKLVTLQKKRVARLLKPFIMKWRRVNNICKKLVNFQKKRIARLLKPLIIQWKRKQPKKCLKCKMVMTIKKYDKCYICFTNDKKKCKDCNKAIPNDYDQCYGCKFKYKCELCNSKMPTDNYKICYSCNMKNKKLKKAIFK